MARPGTWWIVCVLSFSCVSGRRGKQDGAPPELFIFNELCALKDEAGPCKAIKERFFFDVDTGRCQLFEYGGCGGNANNFQSLAECEETCVVSDDKNPCHLSEAPGPCRGLIKRFFFDTQSQQCKHFSYGGCFGNANNFRSMAACQAKCHSPEKHTEAPELQPQYVTDSVVQPTIIAGELTQIQPQVQLNDTNEETDEVKPKGVCFGPVDRGTCLGAEKRFAYNPKTKRCQMFHYSGCGGNENNFMFRKHCIRKCIRNRKADRPMMIRIRRKNIPNVALHAH